MTILIKQSTACTIMFGPFVDKTDGVTLKTDATTITDIDHASTGIFLSKNGGTAAIRHATVTASIADAYGMMKVTLDTTDTNTLGSLDVLFAKAATYLPVHKTFEVIAANVYDSLIGGGDVLDVSAIQFAGQTITAAAGVTIPSSIASPTNITAASGVALAAGQKVDVDTIKTNPVVNGGTVTFPTNATLASTTNITAAAGIALAAGQKVDVDTIKTNPVVNAGTVTFPTGATLASTTNITAGTITTVTNLTNAPTNGDLTATMKTSVTTAATAATPTAKISTGTGAGQLSIASGVVESNMTQIDGATTNGNNATLNLKAINIDNNSGNGVYIRSQTASAMVLTATAAGSTTLWIRNTGSGAADAVIIEATATGIGISADNGGAGKPAIDLSSVSGKSIRALNDIAVSDGDLTVANLQLISAGQITVKKNTALPDFAFVMTDVDGVPLTGLSPAAERRIDAGSFAACANTPATELANGWYTIDLDASDLNGTAIALRFSDTGASDTNFTIITQD